MIKRLFCKLFGHEPQLFVYDVEPITVALSGKRAEVWARTEGRIECERCGAVL